MATNSTFILVDDDESIRNILRIRILSYFSNITIIESHSVAEAKEHLKNIDNSLSLVFLDQHLPDGVGDDLINHPRLTNVPIIAMSSDTRPDLPARTLKGGARFFVTKDQISHSFFLPLVEAIVDRANLDKKLREKEDSLLKLETVKTLIRTLQHEINNPLGALFGASYLLNQPSINQNDKLKAIALIEKSSKRIHSVLEKLVEASSLSLEEKGKEELYRIPGDQEWKQS